MNQTSPAFHRILLVLTALAVFGAVVWAGMQVFQAVPIPPVPPAKPLVSFDPRADVRKNSLFGGLSAVFTGFVTPGALGRPNPFASIGTEQTSSSLPISSLATVREVSLNGQQALAFTPSKDGGILLLSGIPDPSGSGAWSYEVRRFAEEGTLDAVGQWNVPAVPAGNVTADAITPIAILQDNQGKVWLLSREGRVGSLGSDGTPVWASAALFTSVEPARVSRWGGFALDGAGRIWVTDGNSVHVGNGSGFQAVDLLAQLSTGTRATVEESVRTALDPRITDGWSRPLAADLDKPRRLQQVGGGRMGIITPAFGAVFPVTLQGPAEVTFGLAQSADQSVVGVAAAYSPDGNLWSSTQSKLTRHSVTSTQEYDNDDVLPRQARVNPFVYATGRNNLYALDYSVEGTVLWKTVGNDWTAQIVLPQGPQPNDQADKVTLDSRGNMWAILAHRGLLFIRAATE